MVDRTGGDGEGLTERAARHSLGSTALLASPIGSACLRPSISALRSSIDTSISTARQHGAGRDRDNQSALVLSVPVLRNHPVGGLHQITGAMQVGLHRPLEHLGGHVDKAVDGAGDDFWSEDIEPPKRIAGAHHETMAVATGGEGNFVA